jgi:thiol-disulfide isomerase/thioredoxin
MTQRAIEVERLLDDLGDALHRYRARRRRRSVRMLVAAAVAAVAVTSIGATYGVLWGVQPPFKTLKEPVVLPAFSGRDILTGRRVDRSDIIGRAGFLIFWQSDCRPCIPQLAALQSFAAANPNTPILGIDANDLPAAAKKELRQMHVSFPSIAGSLVFGRLRIVGYPTVFAFDANGKVIAVAIGETTSSKFLRAALKRLATPGGGGG